MAQSVVVNVVGRLCRATTMGGTVGKEAVSVEAMLETCTNGSTRS